MTKTVREHAAQKQIEEDAALGICMKEKME